jgi:hypothetical protein
MRTDHNASAELTTLEYPEKVVDVMFISSDQTPKLLQPGRAVYPWLPERASRQGFGRRNV